MKLYDIHPNAKIGENVQVGNFTTICDDVVIGDGTVIEPNVTIYPGARIGKGCHLEKAIVAEDVTIGDNVRLGIGDEAENDTRPDIYNHGLVTVGERSTVPDNVSIGKNSVVAGELTASDFPDGMLSSGSTLIKGGDRA